MSEVYVTPGNRDSGSNLLAVAVVIVALVALGIFGYTRGWFLMAPTAVTPGPSSSINVTTPTPIVNPTPTPAPTPTPTANPTSAPTP